MNVQDIRIAALCLLALTVGPGRRTRSELKLADDNR
jgi:hypothetical protein